MQDATFVLVRAYGGEPLRRIAQALVQNRAIIVRNEDLVSGEVGFPREDVFRFDPGLFDKLKRAFERDRTALVSLWKLAVPVEDGDVNGGTPSG